MIVLALFCASPALASPRQRLVGHVPEGLSAAPLLGPAPEQDSLELAIGLPLRNEADLERTLQELQDPQSPRYHQFLSRQQFTEQFGPSQADYQALIEFAAAQGLAVASTQPTRLVLNLSGSVKDVNAAFHIQLQQYQRPDGTTFHAPDIEPSVDLGLRLGHISGLDDMDRPHPMLIEKRALPLAQGLALPNKGTGHNGLYAGNDFRGIYAPCTSLSGAGISVALVEYDNYYDQDLARYASAAGIAKPNPHIVLVDQSSAPSPGSGNGEVSLDIDMVAAMAPGASIYVFEEPNGHYPAIDMLHAIANHEPVIPIISSSWSWTGSYDSNIHNVCAQFAAQGQSFFQASGDKGAYVTGAYYSVPPHPSKDSALITVVGGTTLSTTGSGGSLGSYSVETTWNTWADRPGNSVSGGGICSSLALPSWQQGLASAANYGSSIYRNIPDVSMVGDGILLYYNNDGIAHSSGGTSASAPLWAAFVALAAEQAFALGKGPFGSINAALYGQALSAYAADFHDINDGSMNNWVSSSIYYPALGGYDLATGLGSPRCQLIADLVGLAPALMPMGTKSLIVYPNPLHAGQGGRALFRFPTGQPVGVKLQVFDRAWRLVAEISGSQVDAAQGLAVWDGKDRHGDFLNSGMYPVMLVGGKSDLRGKITILR